MRTRPPVPLPSSPARGGGALKGGGGFSLVIPVRNGGDLFVRCIRSVLGQSLKPTEIIIFDTESTDGAIARVKPLIQKIPLRTISIRKEEFDHGGTRNAALKLAKHPWVLYLTQDAVCADADSFANLLSATKTKGVVAAYGKQLPHTNANPLAATARTFNYGDTTIVQSMARSGELGIKTWFVSNSFCLWNKAALTKAGGFAEKLILGEDMHAAARLVQSGGTVIYTPAAQVFHSHNYSAPEEFRRYFDIGVFHELNAALLFRAGNASKEGLKFVLAQARILWHERAYGSLMRLPFHVAAKFIGYKLGRSFKVLGSRISRMLSMHKGYWT